MSLLESGNEPSRSRTTRIGAAFVAVTLALSHILIVQTPASAAHEIQVPMGTLTDFSVLATDSIDNTAASGTSFWNSVGVAPGATVTEISEGDITDGAIHLNDAEAIQAQVDFNVAYDYAAAQAHTLIEAELGGQTLTPGVYGAGADAATALTMVTALTLDAEGDKNGVFIIRTAGALSSTATNGNVVLINGAQACNVFFQVGGAVSLGADTSFSGIILSKGAITGGAGTSVNGRAFTGAGAIGLNGNTFQDPTCDGTTVTPTHGLVTTEAGGSDTFTVALNSEPSAEVTIEVSSSDITEGTVDKGLLTFTTEDWETPQTVTVTGVDDPIDDGNIGYTVVLAPAVGGDFDGTDPADVEVTNEDDDTVGVTVTPTSGLVTTEAGDSDTFTVVLDSQPSADVTIPVSSSEATEGTTSASSLAFTTTNWADAQTVTVTGVNDAIVDGDVAYSVVLAAATGGDYDGFDPDDVSVNNVDNDPAGITVFPTSGLATTEAGGVATFTVVLGSQPSEDVTIGVSSDDTDEGTVDTALLTFTTLNWDAPQTVTVTGVDDSVVDGGVAYSVVLAAATGPGLYDGIDPDDVAVSNTDDDTVGVTVTPTATPLVTTEAGGMATFTVVLDSQPSADVTIPVSSSDSTEGTTSTSSLAFTSSNWATAQTVTVTGVNDSVVDGDVDYSVVLGVATGGDYAGIDPADVSVTNVDNDPVGITVFPTSGLATTETGGVATFTVVLDSQPSADVTIPVSSSDATEGTTSASSLAFTTTNWATAQTVTVTGVNDSIDDGDVAYSVVLGVATGGDYAGLDPADVAVTNMAGPVPACTHDFSDVDGSNIFEAAICWLADQGITKGCNPPSNTEFCPDDPVTRGQMAAFLVRAFGYTDDGGGNLFTDDNGTTFEAAIDRLGTAGVTKGCNPPSNTEFCPDHPVTRGQMAAFLVRAFGYTDDGGGNLFTDDNGTTFEAAIDRLGTAGVTRGCNPPSNTQFCPNDNVTREQMATFLKRAFEG